MHTAGRQAGMARRHIKYSCQVLPSLAFVVELQSSILGAVVGHNRWSDLGTELYLPQHARDDSYGMGAQLSAAQETVLCLSVSPPFFQRQAATMWPHPCACQPAALWALNYLSHLLMVALTLCVPTKWHLGFQMVPYIC